MYVILFSYRLFTVLLSKAFNYAFKSGVLAPLFGDRLRIYDRFTMGGIGTSVPLRGFRTRGVATVNNSAADEHGGNMYYSSMAQVTFPIPFLTHVKDFVRGQVFANGGNLFLYRKGM